MKIKDKLLIIISIIILLLFISTNVFASEGDFESIENFEITDTIDFEYLKSQISSTDIENFDSFPKHFIVFGGTFIEIWSSEDILVKNNTYNTYGPSHSIKFYKSTGKLYTSRLNADIVGYSSIGYEPSNVSIVYSNSDIYDINGELVFQLPPQAEQTILAPIVEETETSKTLLEVKKILPMILVVLVSFLGLRKALKMLSMLLHRS